jgi:flavin reductase (DIM6/NTAB) family NADH-FMN oxidoreductase RutF
VRAALPRYQADTEHLREVFSYFPSGVVAVLAHIEGEPRGIVAAAFTVGVSMDPPLVSCAIQNTSQTWPVLKRAETIGISVLGEDQGALCRQLASQDRAARFDNVPLRDTGSSALFIAGAPVWFECTVAGEFPAGDHVVALLEVHGLGADPGLNPLVFHGSSFRQLLLPSTAVAPVPGPDAPATSVPLIDITATHREGS